MPSWVEGAILEKYSMSGAIVQTVKPPPPVPELPPELLTGTGVAGIADGVGEGEGSAVFVGARVAVGMIRVDGGLSVAGGIAVRVGRRVGGTGVGVGSAPHAIIRTIKNENRANRARIRRGINDSNEPGSGRAVQCSILSQTAWIIA